MPIGELIKEGTFHLPTYLKDKGDDATAKVSLFVRHYALRRGPKTGKLRLKIDRDVLSFDNEDAMVAAIEQSDWDELPIEAEVDPGYVPAGFDPEDVAVEA